MPFFGNSAINDVPFPSEIPNGIDTFISRLRGER